MTSKRILQIIFIWSLYFCLSAELVAQGPTPDPRFGIADAYLNTEQATIAGAGYTRIVLRWDLIQPAGRDDWKPANVPDPFIAAEQQAGREIVAVLIGTPDWASQGLNDPRAVPDLEGWGHFTKRMAQQYKGRIKHWIIWNQPDVWDTANPANTWLGSAEDYVALLKSAYSNIKLVDPSMEVHLAGLTYYRDAQHDRKQYLDRLLQIITTDPEASKHDFYFDAAVYHLYHNPRQAFDILVEARSLLDAYRLGNKPIWINELNAPPTDELAVSSSTTSLAISSQEQAAFVIQSFALLTAGGAKRIQFHKMRDEGNLLEGYAPIGLLRVDNSPRPAFRAYQVVTGYFSGYTNHTWFQQGGNYVITLDRQGETTTILWTTQTTDQSFTLNAIASQATLVDESGNKTVLNAVNGFYHLTLPAATCSAGWCIVGGAPRILVEDGSPDQRPALIPLATPTQTPTPLPTHTPTPIPTETPPANVPNSDPIAASILVNSAVPIGVATATPQVDITKPVILPSQSMARQSVNAPAVLPAAAIVEAKPTMVPQALIVASLGRVLSPNRIVLLVVIGSILFTLFYYLQFRLWRNFRNL